MVAPLTKKEDSGQDIGFVSAKTANQAVLYLEKLNKSFGGQQVLTDLFLTLRKGEIVCLRGENGSGKTTLLNILSGNLKPDSGKMAIRINGRQEDFRFPMPWWKNMNPFSHFTPERVAREGIGRTWQEIRLFPNQTLLENIAVASPEQKGENPIWALLRPLKVWNQEKEITLKTRSTLKALGLSGREDSSADMVSLGQSKRVAIARAIQAGAKVLLLDEPLAGLDEKGINGIMGLLEDLCKDKQITLIIVEHIFNIPRILNLATTVWTLQGGKLFVQRPSNVREEIKHNTLHNSTAWLKELAGQGWHFNERELPGGAVLTTVNPAGSIRGEVLIEIQDLIVYRGKRLVIGKEDSEGNLQGLSFSLCKGQLAILEAPNGWGKTTLLEAISGILPITRGTIRLNGQPIQNLPAWDRSNLGISLLRSHSQLFPDLTLQDLFQLSQVLETPETMKPILKRRVSSLSGGEKQKAAFVCVTNGRPFFVGLLDEPFSALDSESIIYHGSLLTRLLEKDKGLLISVPIMVISNPRNRRK